jgi:hypothetical protein
VLPLKGFGWGVGKGKLRSASLFFCEALSSYEKTITFAAA